MFKGRCFITNCPNSRQFNVKSHNEERRISYHRFPDDEIVRNQWIKNILVMNGQVTKSDTPKSTICSKHFEPECLYIRGDVIKFQMLRKGSIPTIFPNHNSTDNENLEILYEESSGMKSEILYNGNRRLNTSNESVKLDSDDGSEDGNSVSSEKFNIFELNSGTDIFRKTTKNDMNVMKPHANKFLKMLCKSERESSNESLDSHTSDDSEKNNESDGFPIAFVDMMEGSDLNSCDNLAISKEKTNERDIFQIQNTDLMNASNLKSNSNSSCNNLENSKCDKVKIPLKGMVNSAKSKLREIKKVHDTSTNAREVQLMESTVKPTFLGVPANINDVEKAPRSSPRHTVSSLRNALNHNRHKLRMSQQQIRRQEKTIKRLKLTIIDLKNCINSCTHCKRNNNVKSIRREPLVTENSDLENQQNVRIGENTI